MKDLQKNNAAIEHEFQVGGAEALERLDRFLSNRLEGSLSREKIKKIIQDGQVSINGKPCISPKRGVLAGEKISLVLPQPAPALLQESGELDILYEDSDLAVINKPFGISVHPSAGEASGTLVNRLLARFPTLSLMEGDRPGIVHRLDKDTTGLMLVALNEATRLEMIDAFARRDVGKEYLALVYGVPKRSSGRIDAPIGRDSRNKTKMAVHDKPRPGSDGGARPARSDYRSLYEDPLGRFALLAVKIHSGRTHQIRVHLSHIGNPIIGDLVYADEAAIKKALSPRALSPELKLFLSTVASHQLLHAWRLNFSQPGQLGENGLAAQLNFCIPPPADFKSAARALSARILRVVLTGSPGCGKSSLLKIFKERGIPTWSADEAVAEQYRAGADAWSLIKAQFGKRFMLAAHKDSDDAPGAPDVDKSALFQAMCNNDGLRRSIENIIHPIVLAEMMLFWERLDVLPLGERLAVAEVPLYLEASSSGGIISRSEPWPGFAPSRPLVIGIHCPFEIRAQRLKKTRQWPGSMIEKIESWQWAEDKKMAACDIVIDNSGSEERLLESAEAALARLEAMHQERAEELEKTLNALCACSEF